MASGLDLRGVRGSKGRTLLHFAAAERRLKVCKFLVEGSGLHVDSTSAEGETPILLAAGAEGRDALPVLRYLLDRGGDPAMPDARGSTPLHNAAEYGNCKAVRLLLSKGAPVDPLGHRGTPLHLAAGYGHEQAVKILLEHGADPNRVVSHVNSPLLAACYAHSLECMKLLVEAGADVNFRSPSAPTVLMLAVDDGLTDIVNFLLEVGSDPNIHDSDGKFPIMLAAAHEHRELAEILFPRTKLIPSMIDWSVDGIIRDMKYPHLEPRAMRKDPLDATLLANRSLCWLRLREGERALSDARDCRVLNPRWAKAWYREGAALSLLKNYKTAADAFVEALKLDPANNEIKKALRHCSSPSTATFSYCPD